MAPGRALQRGACFAEASLVHTTHHHSTATTCNAARPEGGMQLQREHSSAGLGESPHARRPRLYRRLSSGLNWALSSAGGPVSLASDTDSESSEGEGRATLSPVALHTRAAAPGSRPAPDTPGPSAATAAAAGHPSAAQPGSSEHQTASAGLAGWEALPGASAAQPSTPAAPGNSPHELPGSGEELPCDDSCPLCTHVLWQPVATTCAPRPHAFCGRCWARWAAASARAAPPRAARAAPSRRGGADAPAVPVTAVWPGGEGAAEGGAGVAVVSCPLCRAEVPAALPVDQDRVRAGRAGRLGGGAGGHGVAAAGREGGERVCAVLLFLWCRLRLCARATRRPTPRAPLRWQRRRRRWRRAARCVCAFWCVLAQPELALQPNLLAALPPRSHAFPPPLTRPGGQYAPPRAAAPRRREQR
jgi:hypothetical protein